MTPTQRLIERLKSELGIVIDESEHVTHHKRGFRQRSAGMWAWHISNRIGSEIPVKTLVSAKKLTISSRGAVGISN